MDGNKLEDLFDTSQYIGIGTELPPDDAIINISSTDSFSVDLENDGEGLPDLPNLYGDEFLSENDVINDIRHPIPSNLPGNTFIPSKAKAHSQPHNHSHSHNTSGAFINWKATPNMQAAAVTSILQLYDQKTTAVPRKICSNCGSISTPSWRRCPEGRNLLCNACGLYQKLHKRPRPLRIREDGSVQVIRNVASLKNICQHCKTTETPIWRRSSQDKSLLLCNACALYLRNHQNQRPLSDWSEFPNEGEYYEKL